MHRLDFPLLQMYMNLISLFPCGVLSDTRFHFLPTCHGGKNTLLRFFPGALMHGI